MVRSSAGILIFRQSRGKLEVLLANPGGPFWKNKDEGAWTIPKGEIGEQEDPRQAAIRETEEELGISVKGELIALTPLKQKSGKVIMAWALEMDLDADSIVSNEFEMEWPPRSGQMKSFPEIDRAEWFSIKEAMEKILPGQAGLLKELQHLLGL